MKRRALVVTTLAVAILATGVGVVDAKHETRMLFHKLQKARAERAQAQARWSQLKLEQTTWARPERVGRIAREALDMRAPKHYSVVRGGP